MPAAMPLSCITLSHGYNRRRPEGGLLGIRVRLERRYWSFSAVAIGRRWWLPGSYSGFRLPSVFTVTLGRLRQG